MRALTLTQPWAGLVASGIKLVENRPRRIAPRDLFGQRFAIHASRQIDESLYERINEIDPELRNDPEWPMPWEMLSRTTSAVIAVATLDGYVAEGPHGDVNLCQVPPDQRRWFCGPIGYVLREVRALATPVPCRGALGFWTLPTDIERHVVKQIAEAA